MYVVTPLWSRLSHVTGHIIKLFFLYIYTVFYHRFNESDQSLNWDQAVVISSLLEVEMNTSKGYNAILILLQYVHGGLLVYCLVYL